MDFCEGGVLLSKSLLEVTYGEDQRRCNRGSNWLSLGATTERKLVCVTSGNSYLGAHLIKELLCHGYLIRVTLQNPGDLEDMKRMISNEEMNQLESVVVAKMGNLDALCEAFRGCHAIFHTSSFIDPHGISGYSETRESEFLDGGVGGMSALGDDGYVFKKVR